MKLSSVLWSILVASLGLGGCASSSPQADLQVRPFSEVRDSMGSAEVYYTIGRQLQRAQRFEEAELSYRRALNKDPSHTAAMNGLAVMHAAQGEMEIAIAILKALVQKHPDQAYLWFNLGHAHMLQGELLAARSAFEQAVALAPDYALAFDRLQQVRASLGEPVQMARPAALLPLRGPSLSMNALGVIEASQAIDSTSDQMIEVGTGVYELRPALPSLSIVPPSPNLLSMDSAPPSLAERP